MEQIKEIIENFDFERVHTVMKALNWEWSWRIYDGKIISGIPSVETLKNRATELLETAYNEKEIYSSGGFTATYEEGYLSLEFIVTSYESYMEFI